jgi:hypothetical protein
VENFTRSQSFSNKYMKKGKMPNEQKEPRSDKPQTQHVAYWISIGLALGAGIGLALDNLAIGVGIGLAIGAAIGAAQRSKKK